VSHLVIHDIDGTAQYNRFVAIDEAVALVERLHNEGNGSAHLYRLEEIRFEIKAYYRVEVGTPPPAVAVPREPELESRPAIGKDDPEPMTIEAVIENVEEVEDDSPVAEPVEPAAANSGGFALSSSIGGARRGLFGR
jgi:hypothetical protein